MICQKKYRGTATALGTAIALGISTLTHTQPVSALSLVFNSSGTVSGINNLSVGGQLYNVNFVFSTFVDIFGSPTNLSRTPTFWLNPTGAAQAAQAIISALGSSIYFNTFVEDGQTFFNDSFFVPYNFRTGTLSGRPFFIIDAYSDGFVGAPDEDLLNNTSLIADQLTTYSTPYAVFTPVTTQPESVPEPFMGGAILGLSSLALLSRRKRREPIKQG